MRTILAGKRKKAVLAVLAILILTCVLGWPQWLLVYTALGLYTGSLPSVGSVTLASPLQIEHLSINKNAQYLSCSNLSLDYNFFSQTGRYFPSLRAEAVELPIDIEALPLFKTKPDTMETASVNALKFIPQEIHVGVDHVQFRSGQQTDFISLGPIQLDAVIDSQNQWKINLAGDALGIEGRLGGQTHTFPNIGLNIVADQGGNPDIPSRVHFPKVAFSALPFADVSGTMTADFSSFPELAFETPTFKLKDINLSSLFPEFLPVAVKFDSLDASGSVVNLILNPDNPKISPTQARIQGKGMLIGPPGNEYYKGDFLLSLTGSEKSDCSLLQAEAVFNKGQQAKLRCELKPGQGACILSITDWSQSDLLSVIPKSISKMFAITDNIRSLSSDTTVNYDKQTISGHSSTKLVLQQEGTEEVPAKITGTLNVPISSLYDTHAYSINALIDMQSASAGIEISPPGTVICHVTNMDPAFILNTFTDSVPLPDLHTSLNGSFFADLSANEVHDSEHFIHAKVDLTTSHFAYRGFAVPEGQTITIQGDGKVNNTTPRQMKDCSFLVGIEELGKVTFTNLSLRLDTFAGGGSVETTFELPRIATLYKIGPLKGKVTLQGKVSSNGGYIRSKPEGVIEGFGLDNYLIPQQIRVVAGDDLLYDELNTRMKVPRIEVSGSDNLSLTLREVEATLFPRSFKTLFAGSTDLQLLKSIGLANEAEGSVKFEGNLLLAAEHATGQFSMEAKADTLHFKRPAIAIKNASLSASVTRTAADGLKGSGLLAIQNMGLSTLSALDIKGLLAFEGTEAMLTDGSCTLLGAAINGEARIGVFENEIPVTFKLHVTELNLASIMKELNVEQFKVEGITEGNITGKITTSGIQDLTLAMTSPKGVLLDQRSVAQLLVSQTGNARVVDKIVKKVLGEGEMVPFDKATLNMRYENNQFVGTAHLDGDKLSLVIDLNIDPKAILAALGMDQETAKP